jgi:chromodomain-helicase-DNA-binding protein 1
MAGTTLTILASDHQSDSDLSDVQEPNAIQDSPSPSPQANDITEPLADGRDFEESDQSSDDNASQDADFDMEDDLPSPQSEPVPDPAGSSSRDSSRGAKRKAGIEEDEYIKANPELYGLRRSVRI